MIEPYLEEITMKSLYERIVHLEAKVDNALETGNRDAARFTRYVTFVFISSFIEVALLAVIYWRIVNG